MDLSARSPLLACFVRGDVPREVRLLAARGAVAPRAHEQLALLVLLSDDPDREVADTARLTIDILPREALAAFLARPDVSEELRAYFAARGIRPAGSPRATDDPLIDPGEDLDVSAVDVDEPGDPGPSTPGARRRSLSSLGVAERIKVAMQGTREQRALLVRDSNRVVAAAVLTSPKLTDTEVEVFARMTNVGEDVLRVIGTNRAWLKNYGVVAGLVRNPKTPPAVSLPLVSRLNERDLKLLIIDRNVPDGLRVVARKMLATNESRRR